MKATSLRETVAETLPIHLPKNVVLFLEDLTAAAGIVGGAGGFITQHLVSLIREEPASFCSGILKEVMDHFDLARENDSDHVHTAASRWKIDDHAVIVLDEKVTYGFDRAASPAIPKVHRKLKMDVPETARPIIERLIEVSGFYGSCAEAVGMSNMSWRDACDLAARQIRSNTDMRADGVEKLYGVLHVEKLRVVEYGESLAIQSEREWIFGSDQEDAA